MEASLCFGLTKTCVSALKFAIQEDMTQDTKKKGGRNPLPDNEKRKYSIGTKVNEVEYQILTAKKDKFKMTIYDYLRKALDECIISVKSYDEFVKIVDDFSMSHLMRRCIINSYVLPRVTPEELAAYKDLTMNLRNHGRNIREIAIQANMQSGGKIDYVQVMQDELQWLHNLKKDFQDRLTL